MKVTVCKYELLDKKTTWALKNWMVWCATRCTTPQGKGEIDKASLKLTREKEKWNTDPFISEGPLRMIGWIHKIAHVEWKLPRGTVPV